MMSFLTQLLLISGQAKKEEEDRSEGGNGTVYRPFCADCNEEGRDARHPCEGH